MDTLSFKTPSLSKESALSAQRWLVVDASDQILGRMCTRVAQLLRGKYKPTFTPHVACGDKVIVINADKVRLTGNKWTDRVYVRYTGYPGGQRFTTPAELLKKSPDALVRRVVRGMLPKTKLGRQLLSNLYVYGGSEHPHAAQQPTTIDINALK